MKYLSEMNRKASTMSQPMLRDSGIYDGVRESIILEAGASSKSNEGVKESSPQI